VDAALRLDLRVMRRQGFLVPGAVTSGVQRWTRVATGEESGSVGVTVNLADPEAGFVVVRFNLNGDPRVQEIQLDSRPMRYGGRRYYFLCPKHGRQCEVLPMVGGVFASRQAGRLTCQSQSADQIDRMRDRAHKLEKRLWPDKGKPRPRGRNRERLVEAWSEADSAFENMFAATIMRRWGHLF
jgi:hypothetical protein